MLSLLVQVGIILAAGILLKAVADKVKFPFIVFYVLAGTMLASYGFVALGDESMFAVTELVRTLALIIVVFSAGFYLKLGQVLKHSKEIMWLSSFGVIVTALIIAGISFYLLPISLITAAFLGVLLSGTDPAAISTGSSSGKKNKIMTIISAESLFNQPLTVILPFLLLDYLISPEQAWLNAPKLISLIVVGGGIGFISASLGQRLLAMSRNKHEEIVGLMIAIGTYIVAESMLGSGILAVAVCSVLLSSSKIPEKRWLGSFNKELAFLFTIFVFIMLGAEFTFAELIFTRVEIFAIIIALVVARFAMSLLIFYKSDLEIMDRIKIGLIAPKGMGPAALAPLLLLYPAYIAPSSALFIVKIVYVAIIVSIIFSIFAMKLLVQEGGEKEAIEKEVEIKRKIRQAEAGLA